MPTIRFKQITAKKHINKIQLTLVYTRLQVRILSHNRISVNKLCPINYIRRRCVLRNGVLLPGVVC